MTGDGEMAHYIHQQFAIAKAKYLRDSAKISLNCDLHQHYKTGQLSLF
jgi:hypothetical protein